MGPPNIASLSTTSHSEALTWESGAPWFLGTLIWPLPCSYLKFQSVARQGKMLEQGRMGPSVMDTVMHCPVPLVDQADF